MMQKTKKLQNMTAASLCTVFYMIILRCSIPFIYGIVDDRTMMEFVSGQYLGHPDPHTIFMGYWYSLFLTVLYRLVRNVDWYALCFLILQGCCVSLVIYRLSGRCKSKKQKLLSMAAVLALSAALCLKATVQLSFTTTAAMLGTTVIFWYETAQEIEKKDVLLLFLTMFITCQIRPDIFYMILPLCSVLWIFRHLREKRFSTFQFLIPVAAAIVLLLHAAGELLGYGSAPWQAYETYNQNRSAIYDFPDRTFLPYENAEDFYNRIGIEKKSRARTLMNYNYTADDRITPEFFQQYVDAYNEYFPPVETSAKRAIHSILIYVKGTLTGKFHWQNTFALVLYGILGIWYLYRKQWLPLGKVLASSGIQILLWCYLIYAGRTPDRVIFSMNLMFLVTALLLLLEAWQTIPTDAKAHRFCLGLILCAVCILGSRNLPDIREQNLDLAHWNENVEDLKAYCMSHPENFYFHDVTSLAFTTWNVRLWRDEPYVMNYMSLGNWESYSPIWQEKLSHHGITSVKKALYEQENMYLICSFDKGLEYLEQLYDHVRCEEVDKVSGFHIYKLRMNEATVNQSDASIP